MKPKATPTVELTLESPCPGRLDDLLAIFVDRKGAERTNGASARSHIARCPRCRAFLESQRTLRPLVERAFASLPRGASPVPFSSIRRFESWIKDAIGVRERRGTAQLLCRIANAILSIDQNFATKTVSDSTNTGRLDPTTPISQIEHLVFQFVVHIHGQLETRQAKVHQQQAEALCEMLNGLKHNLAFASFTHCITIARQLLEFASRLAPGSSSPTHIAISNLEWYWGSVSTVPTHLERALQVADNINNRSETLSNLSVWCADKGHVNAAFAYLRSALEARPNKPISLVNQYLWDSITGNRRATNSLKILQETPAGRRVLLLRPLSWYELTLQMAAERFGVLAASADRRRVATLKELNNVRDALERSGRNGGDS